MIWLAELTVTSLTAMTVVGVLSGLLWLAMEVNDYRKGRY